MLRGLPVQPVSPVMRALRVTRVAGAFLSEDNGLVRVTHVFGGVAVSDFSVACEWYERRFGTPPDALTKQGEAVWHLGTSASVYVVTDPTERAAAS